MAALQPKEQGWMVYPASSWRKFMFKAPIVLWRLGLQPLVGRYIILITHIGRKSKLPRRTLTEYHMLDGRQIYVPCAFGARAQWYKNITADPHVIIQTSHGTQRMKARRVTDDDEVLAVYHLIKRRNPLMFDEYLRKNGIANTPEDIIAKKDRVYFITFDPTNEPTPPPLEADLTWVWGVVVGLFVLSRLGRRRASAG